RGSRALDAGRHRRARHAPRPAPLARHARRAPRTRAPPRRWRPRASHHRQGRRARRSRPRRHPPGGSRMSKTAPDLQILTANRLTDGAVVYLTIAGTWTTEIRQSVVAREEKAASALLARGQRDADAAIVVGPY